MKIINLISRTAATCLGLSLATLVFVAPEAEAQTGGSIPAGLIQAVTQAEASGDAAALAAAAQAVILAANGNVATLASAVQQAVSGANPAQQPDIVNAFMQQGQGNPNVQGAVVAGSASSPAALTIAAQAVITSANGNATALAAAVQQSVAAAQSTLTADVVNAFMQHSQGNPNVQGAVVAGSAANPVALATAAQAVIASSSGNTAALTAVVQQSVTIAQSTQTSDVVNAFMQQSQGSPVVLGAVVAGSAGNPTALTTAAQAVIALAQGDVTMLTNLVQQSIAASQPSQTSTVINAFTQEAQAQTNSNQLVTAALGAINSTSQFTTSTEINTVPVNSPPVSPN